MRHLLPILILTAALGCGGTSVENGVEPDVDPAVGTESPSTATSEATPAPGAPVAEDDAYGLENGQRVSETLVTGGQPDDATLERAADAGVTTVISLRQPSEPGFEEERAKVEALGMTFVSIPVAGAEGVTPDNARAVDEALSGAEGEVILHCGSGNRVGALLALRAFHLENRSAEEALALGREAGLTGLEDTVRQHFETWCGDHADAAQC